MHEASVTSLAILKVNSDSGQDYIENFVPFVSEAVRRAPQDEISVIEVQSVIKDEFGLVIPQGALVTLLNRAERKGIVRRANRIYVRNGAAIDPSFERNRAEFSRQYQALLQKLIDFCLSEHNVTLTRAQADDALLAHLQVACIPILAASVDGCPITPPSDSVRHSEFLVNSFIVELYEGDPVGFGFLETVMKGSMLATALFLPELAQAKRKFDKLTVYLDTQLLLRALGLDGGTQEAATKELLTLLYELNITLACFDSTRNELQSVLEAAQNALRDTRQSTRQFGVYKYFLEKKSNASDVELIINNLDVSLRRLRVAIKDRPPHTAQAGLNEARLTEIARAVMPQQRQEALVHDVDALAAIHRLRGGLPKYNIESCMAIFVTSNNGLAAVSARFANNEVAASSVPFCINYHAMATLAWIKNPTISANLSRNRLIAQSYAALDPGIELWRKYSEEISRLSGRGDITAADADLLRFSTTAKKALVELTLGSAEVFSQGTIQDVLEVARREVRKSTEEKLKKEMERRVLAEDLLRTQQGRLEEISGGIGKFLSSLFFFLIMLFLIIGCVSTLPNVWPQKPHHFVELFLLFAVTLFCGFALWSLSSGGTVRQLVRSLEVRIQQRTFGLLIKFLRIYQHEGEKRAERANP